MKSVRAMNSCGRLLAQFCVSCCVKSLTERFTGHVRHKQRTVHFMLCKYYNNLRNAMHCEVHLVQTNAVDSRASFTDLKLKPAVLSESEMPMNTGRNKFKH